MEQLAASKFTIDDLEHNSTITLALWDRNFWFSLASNAVVGILVWQSADALGTTPESPGIGLECPRSLL
jgi:hypothetical protein